MNRNIKNLLGITILVYIVLVFILFYFDIISGKTGDILITTSGVIVALVLYLMAKKKK